MNETTKAQARREAEGVYAKYFVGRGIDIGCGPDPVTPDCERWDLEQGDAQYMSGVEHGAYDFLYSSHCLEHLVAPFSAMQVWWRLVKPGGVLFVVVPDEDLYEQGVFPSRWNSDHKHTFTVHKCNSWSPVSIRCVDLAMSLADAEVLWVRRVDTGYDYSGDVRDRTMEGAEANIELVVRKLAQ